MKSYREARPRKIIKNFTNLQYIVDIHIKTHTGGRKKKSATKQFTLKHAPIKRLQK